MLRLAVLVSGGGTNLQAILDAITAGSVTNAEVVKVISNSRKAYALERAAAAGIPTACVTRREHPDAEDFDTALLAELQEAQADLVVLAGCLVVISQRIVDAYPNRIINIHPALIPSFCGEGFYGLHVHEAALQRGVKVTGATVHFVNEVCDGGPIILQKAVEIRPDDTPETLQRRVMEQAEWELLPRAAALFCDGKITVQNGIASIAG